MRPIIKWAGGKQRVISGIEEYLPKEINTYYELFLGGGALFFYLAERNVFKSAILNDINPRLIQFYEEVKNNVLNLDTKLLKLVGSYQDNPEEFYYKVREWPMTAEVFLFLNKTCYNGLFRLNKSGKFNVPWGKRDRFYYETENLLRASKLLQGAALNCTDYSNFSPSAGDFVYLDPPYIPLNKTSNFVSYTSEGFTLEDHKKLANYCGKLRDNGVAFILSNSATETTRELYEGFEIKEIYAKRLINCKTEKRGKIKELLIISR